MAKTDLSLAKLKKKADQIYSIYVRIRDSDKNGYAECITCDVQKPWKDMQAGHFISRRFNILRFVDANVNAQCVKCNVFRYGEQYAYSRAIDLKYGTGTALELHSMQNDYHKFTRQELEVIIKEAKDYIGEFS